MSARGTCTSTDAESRHAADRRWLSRRLSPKATISLAMAVALTIGGSVQAATVSAVQGQVLVNSGQGYRLVDGSTTLGVGGTVVANPGAIAYVLYPGGCRVTVEPGSVYQIASQPPCQGTGETKVGGLNDKGADKSSAPPSTTSSGANPWLIGAAGLAIGGGAAAYYVMSLSP
jgi:hypothetical protein